MNSLSRLIAIVIIWIVAGGTAVSMFSVSFLGALGSPAVILLLTAVIFGAAAYATAALVKR